MFIQTEQMPNANSLRQVASLVLLNREMNKRTKVKSKILNVMLRAWAMTSLWLEVYVAGVRCGGPKRWSSYGHD